MIINIYFIVNDLNDLNDLNHVNLLNMLWLVLKHDKIKLIKGNTINFGLSIYIDK
ncbi:MAG: hypothetical protein ACTSO2_18140 [Promethearchaeota archaeon]